MFLFLFLSWIEYSDYISLFFSCSTTLCRWHTFCCFILIFSSTYLCFSQIVSLAKHKIFLLHHYKSGSANHEKMGQIYSDIYFDVREIVLKYTWVRSGKAAPSLSGLTVHAHWWEVYIMWFTKFYARCFPANCAIVQLNKRKSEPCGWCDCWKPGFISMTEKGFQKRSFRSGLWIIRLKTW